ncbi:MAG: hypothetical protein WC749_02050 [Dehalococcoidia bacterium]
MSYGGGETINPEELHRKVFDELGKGSGQASYDAALLRVIAPYLHTTRKSEVEMIPFNESGSLQVDELTIESREDRVTLYGSVDITRDWQGLDKARALKEVVDRIAFALEREEADGALPEVIQVQEPETVVNPFE